MRMLGMGRAGLGALVLTGVSLVLAHCGSSAGENGLASDGQAGAVPALPELQESDIFKRDGNRLYVLNRFRGLMVADLANPAEPVLSARLPIPAQPREMWFNDSAAFIITASPVAYGQGWWWGDGVASVDVNTWATYRGSSLVVADVTDPLKPSMASMLALGGDCFDGRLRGHVLYLGCVGSAAQQGDTDTHIYAVDVSNKAAPRVVSSVAIPTSFGQTHHLHVTQDHIFVGGSDDGFADTRITVVDIRSEEGAVALRGSFTVPGSILDRFCMDAWEGHLRVASGTIWGNGDMHVTTWSLEDADHPQQVGHARMRIEEQLKSARFDGPRGYVVTFRNVDPLFVFDLQNPAEPHSIGELHVSGWMDFLVPVGNRLLAMGHDDVVESKPNIFGWQMTRRTLAVSLIDVSGEPRLLSRIPLDGAWGTVPAERDDFNKLFRVFPEEGLVVFPYRTFAQDTWQQRAGMLLLDWQDDALTLRADMQDIGQVERGLMWNPGTLVTLSVQSLQTFDVADHAAPRQLGYLELATQVRDFVMLQNGTLVEMSGTIHGGRATLRAWNPAAMGATALSSLSMDAMDGYIRADGNLVYFVDVHRPSPSYLYGTAEKPEDVRPTSVTVVDFADPLAPVVRSTLSLGDEVVTSNEGSVGSAWAVDPMALAAPGVLVLQKAPVQAYSGCSDASTPGKLVVLDLRNADAPREVKRLDLEAAWGGRLDGGGGRVLVLGYAGVQVLDVSNVDSPRLTGLQREGMAAVAADAEAGTVVMLTTFYGRAGTTSHSELLLMRLEGNTLVEKSRVGARSGMWGATGLLRGGRLVMLDGTYGSAEDLQVYTVDGDRLSQPTAMPGTSLATQVTSLADGHAAYRSADGMVHVVNLDAGGVMVERLAVPLAGEGGAVRVMGNALVVAAGYHGLVRQALAQ